MLDGKQCIDISLPIYTGMASYPNNPEVVVESFEGREDMSVLHLGSHTGTHVDAPRHAFADGIGIGEVSLEALIGSCRVLDMRHVQESITVEDLRACDMKAGERILVVTKNSDAGYTKFRENYVYLGESAAHYLVDVGVRLFGIDYFSVKKHGDSNIQHEILLKNNIVIVEGVDLSQVEPGEYTFVGLPLKIQGCDGAPMRAVLCK